MSREFDLEAALNGAKFECYHIPDDVNVSTGVWLEVKSFTVVSETSIYCHYGETPMSGYCYFHPSMLRMMFEFKHDK